VEGGGAVRLFLLNQTGKCHAGETSGLVIAALDEDEAREIAARNSGDEGEITWLSSSRSSCETIGTGNQLQQGILLRAFGG
jgi:hypothetical protein